MNGSFAGDITATAAWEGLAGTADAVLLDVRTQPEWVFVGVPEVSGCDKTLVQVSWQLFPTMARNPNFVADLLAKGVNQSRPVYLICRSGVRSRAAAEFLAQHGYTTYNILDGFEGQLDAHGHRGAGGWKALGLPWKQS